VRYRTIVADPPWPYPEGFGNLIDTPHKQDRERGMRGTTFGRKPLPYASMTLEEIAVIPVSDLAHADARLFCWATNRYLVEALRIVSGWGFTYKQMIVWDKTPTFSPMPAHIAPNAAEFLIVATRGKPGRKGTWKTSVVNSRKPRAEHSRKPEVFLDLAEAVSQGPYLELFARRNRLGWDTWGNESLEHVGMVSE
jgi:N6-adenosine-specific RNA methylase IME4